MTETGEQKLKRLASAGEAGEVVETVSVRTLLSWFEQKRRGYLVAQTIRAGLESADLVTDPDFEEVNIDALVQLKRKAKAIQGHGAVVISPPTIEAHGELLVPTVLVAPSPPATESTPEQPISDHSEPSFRLSRLKAATNRPVSVSPDVDLKVAVTTMLGLDFSQLPVMTNEREVRGVVSWRSIASRLATGHQGSVVREFMDVVHILESNASFFDAVRVIIENQYVLVRATDKRISGIVTSSDLCSQFEALTEPFLLLYEIENDLRRVLQQRFSVEELAAAKDPRDSSRTITSANDMTFGEYVRLLESPERWQKLSTKLDRNTFVQSLKRVNDIRNDVMHFDPDAIPDDELEVLRLFARLMRRLKEVGVT